MDYLFLFKVFSFLLGLTPFGAFFLGVGVFTAQDFLPFIIAGYVIKNTRPSLSSWYSPAFFCFSLPLLFTFLAPPYIPIDSTFVIGLCSFLLLAGKLDKPFFLGLGLGATAHLILLIASLIGYPLISEESFWAGQRRFGGLFTDPNAAGLVFFLLLGIRELKYFSLLGLFTGSRSYLIGLILSLKFRYSIILFISLAILLLIAPPEVLPSSFSRLLSGGLNDRVLFWWAAIQDFLSSPLTGVGPDGFRQSIRLNHHELFGNWIDNPNNYYLLILSEWGVAGFYIACLTGLRFVKSGAEISRICYVFFGLLFLGSHLLSLEVAVVLASIVRPGERSLQKDYLGVALGVVFSVLLWFSDRGVYPWERDTDGPFRWTKERAVFGVKCSDDVALIRIEGKAVVRANGVVYSGDELRIPCRSRSKVVVTLTSHDAFTPANDQRVLGAKLRYESP